MSPDPGRGYGGNRCLKGIANQQVRKEVVYDKNFGLIF